MGFLFVVWFTGWFVWLSFYCGFLCLVFRKFDLGWLFKGFLMVCLLTVDVWLGHCLLFVTFTLDWLLCVDCFGC